MYFDFASILVFFIFGLIFVALNVSVLSRILRPAIPQQEKATTYECGEPPLGSSWIRFDIRFYTVALVFLIFDVEVAFLYPWAGIFKEWKDAGRASGSNELGTFLFAEMLIFIGILVVGYIYVWAKGDLNWVKSVSGQSADRQES